MAPDDAPHLLHAPGVHRLRTGALGSDVSDRESERPMVAELRERIEEDARRYGGTLPREAAVAWGGYLAGLIEWDVLSVAEHERLCRLLPPVDDSPVLHILIGWDEDEEVA
jgi:hypothetical protein